MDIPMASSFRRAGILYANEPAAEMLGVASAATLLGRPFFDLVAPEDRVEARIREREIPSAGRVPAPRRSSPSIRPPRRSSRCIGPR
jgi:PAS domain-containing protein